MNEIIVTEEHSRAVSLHRKIKANVQCAKETFLELGKSLKEMRDGKLYKELGYQNFEEYCEAEAEIGRRHSYRMIQIVENLPEDFVTSMSQIGTTKLSLLAMLDPTEREELQQTVDVEQTSVRELKAEIDALKKEKKQAEADAENARIEAEAARTRADHLSEQVESLEEQVESLENRPVNVAVSVEAENQVEELKSVLKQTDLAWGQKYAKLEEEGIKLRRQDYQQHQKELEEVRAEYEQKLADVQVSPASEKVPDHMADFKAFLSNAADSMNRMASFILAHKDDADHAFYQKKALEMLECVRGVLS